MILAPVITAAGTDAYGYVSTGATTQNMSAEKLNVTKINKFSKRKSR